MSELKWLDLIPSIMSALASVAAAVAAFISLRISREAQLLAKKSALTTHHGEAAKILSDAAERLKKITEIFSELAYQETCVDWASEIEALDSRQAGGSNPRPLRHVLTNASEMLVKHGITRGATFRHAAQSIFSIVRDGIPNLNDTEYEKLLRQADGKYWNFEEVFGVPSINKGITSSPAFRWACYQLDRRIDQNKWCEIWGEAWHDTGVLNKLCTEHSKIKPDLELILTSLKLEKAKLEHTEFPLKSNVSLCLKYDEVLGLVEVLLEYGGLQRVEWFSETSNQEYLPHLDIITLVLYSMGIAFLAHNCLQKAYEIQND